MLKKGVGGCTTSFEVILMWVLEVLAMLEGGGGAKGFHPLKVGGGGEKVFIVSRVNHDFPVP